MKKSINLILGLLFTANIAFAQQEDVDVIQSESNAIVVTNASDMDGDMMETTVMAFDSSDMDGGMFFSTDMMDAPFALGGGGGGSPFSMLNNPSVQKDLQLVDEQMDQINQINKDFGEKIRDKVLELRNGDSSGLMELIGDLKEKQNQQIESILLPNQQARLKQVSRQMKLKRLGSERALTDALAEDLGITDEQKKSIKNKAKELQSELEKKFAELKAKAKKELFEELTKEQQSKLEELLGDELVIKEEDQKGHRKRIQQLLNRQKKKSRDF